MSSMYGFKVPFEFPLHFTRGVFATHNPLLASVVARLEPARRHGLLVVIDKQVAAATPNYKRPFRATHPRITRTSSWPDRR